MTRERQPRPDLDEKFSLHPRKPEDVIRTLLDRIRPDPDPSPPPDEDDTDEPEAATQP
jgi:hypothetical protein